MNTEIEELELAEKIDEWWTQKTDKERFEILREAYLKEQGLWWRRPEYGNREAELMS